MRDVAIRDLQPLQAAAHVAPRLRIQQLSDVELLETAKNPKNKDDLTINTQTGLLLDGNGRAHELLRRASDPNSTITPDTMVPVEDYEPDLSMFPELD